MTSLSYILSAFASWVMILNQIWDNFSTQLIDFFPLSASSGSLIFILNITGLGKLSLLEVMIGGGLFSYISYKLIKFLISLNT